MFFFFYNIFKFWYIFFNYNKFRIVINLTSSRYYKIGKKTKI